MAVINFKAILRKDALQILVDWIVGNVEYILIRASPVLAPVPSAFALSYALQKADWAWANEVGWIIESLGVGSGVLMAVVSVFNQKYPGWSLGRWIQYGPFVFYVIVAALLIFGYETLPVIIDASYGLATGGDIAKAIVPLLFPGLTLIGAVIIGVRDYMDRIEAQAAHELARVEATQDAKQRKADAEFDLDLEIKRREAEQRLELQRLQAEQKMAIERQKAEAKLSKPVSKTVQSESSKTVQDKGGVDDMLSIYRSNPHASYRDVGDRIGRSPQTVANWLDRLESEKRIHRNGRGVEVI